MSSATPQTPAEPEIIAVDIVEAFAAQNKGVAEVIPADRIRSEVEDVVERSEALGEDDCEDLYVDVKDAVLEQGVVIA
jgi:tRNA splicing endonuclease